MKKVAFILAATLFAGAAVAQTALDEETIATARALMDNAKQADNVATVVDADVTAIVINLQAGSVGARNGAAVVGLTPSDPEFAQVLAIVKGVGAKKRDDFDAKLGAMGMSRKPATPGQPVAPGNPN